MSDWKQLESRFERWLKLPARPVAVAFLDAEPAGVTKFRGSEPSGCSFWRLAAGGRAFYTVPSDHYNCPVGSYTHNIPLPSERAAELNETLGLMMSVGYVKQEEIPRIPTLAKTPAAIVYAPLADTPASPDVVLFRCRPATAMVLQESASRAGAVAAMPALGRPTCMALPAAVTLGGSVTSFGCVGNRTYTGAGEDELYIAIPGAALEKVADALETIGAANQAVGEYAANRRAALTSE